MKSDKLHFIVWCEKLHERILEGERKHPAAEWRGRGLVWALWQFACEVGEAMQAECKHEGENRVRDELMDACAVAYRIARGDWR